MFNNTPVDSRTNDRCWLNDPTQPCSYQTPRLLVTSSYVPDYKVWSSDCYTCSALRSCYKHVEVTSNLSTSLRTDDFILRITGTSGPIHIDCDSFRMEIWQIVGPFVPVFWYFESQRRDQLCPYEKRSPLPCRVIATQAVTSSGHRKFTRPPPSTLFHVTQRLCCVETGAFWSSVLISLEAKQCWHNRSTPHYRAGMLTRLH